MTEKRTAYSFVRVSTDKQNLETQHAQIRDYANQHGFIVTSETTVECVVSGLKNQEHISDFLKMIEPNSVVLVAELSRLGRNTLQVLQTVEELKKRSCEVHIIRQSTIINKHGASDMERMNSDLILNVFSMVAQMEREMLSQRTKDALQQRKEQGYTLGRPKGGTNKGHKLDSHKQTIISLLKDQRSFRFIAEAIGSNVATVSRYIKRHNLSVDEQLDSSSG